MATTRTALLVLPQVLVVAATASPAEAAFFFSRSSQPGVSSPKCDWRWRDLEVELTTECARMRELVFFGCCDKTWARARGTNRCYVETGRRSLTDAFHGSDHYACGAVTRATRGQGRQPPPWHPRWDPSRWGVLGRDACPGVHRCMTVPRRIVFGAFSCPGPPLLPYVVVLPL